MTDQSNEYALRAKLFNKLRLIMAEMEEVPKLGQAPSQMGGYKFARDPEVKDAVRKGMVKHNVMWIPGCIGFTQEVAGPKRIHTHAQLEATFVDTETGYHWTVPWAGECLDTGDKGVGKSVTLGFKSFWLTAFAIPTDEDPDGYHYQRGEGSENDEPVRSADPKTFKLRFGKHKGKTIAEVGSNPDDAGWLKWALENLDDDERNAELLATIRAYFGMVDSPAPQPTAKSGGHWTETQDWKAFYAAASKLGLSNPDVHAALKVESAKSYTGTKEEAWLTLVQFATEVVTGWQNHSKLLEEWFKFLNSIPADKRPAPNEAVRMLVGDGGNIAQFSDTLAIAKNVVLGKLPA